MTFEEGISRLKAYVEKNGHAQVPYTYVDEDGAALGKWVSRQREVYHEGKMPVERISALNDQHFVWKVDHKAAQQKTVEASFNEFYSHLEAFRKEFGHCDVAQTYTSPDGYRLGAVVNKKRIRPERMTREQIRKLKEIGFPFASENRPWGRTKVLNPIQDSDLLLGISCCIAGMQDACLGLPVVAVISSDNYFHGFFSNDEAGTAVIVARAVYEYIKAGKDPIIDMMDAIFGDETIDLISRMKKKVITGPYNSSLFKDLSKHKGTAPGCTQEWEEKKRLYEAAANINQDAQRAYIINKGNKIVHYVTRDATLNKDNVSALCGAFPLSKEGCVFVEDIMEEDRKLVIRRLVAAYVYAQRMRLEKRYDDRWLGSFQKATASVNTLGMLRNMVNRLIEGATNEQLYEYAENN